MSKWLPNREISTGCGACGRVYGAPRWYRFCHECCASRDVDLWMGIGYSCTVPAFSKFGGVGGDGLVYDRYWYPWMKLIYRTSGEFPGRERGVELADAGQVVSEWTGGGFAVWPGEVLDNFGSGEFERTLGLALFSAVAVSVPHPGYLIDIVTALKGRRQVVLPAAGGCMLVDSEDGFSSKLIETMGVVASFRGATEVMDRFVEMVELHTF